MAKKLRLNFKLKISVSSKKQLLVLGGLLLLFGFLTATNVRLHQRTIIPIIYIVALFLIGITTSIIFKRKLQSLFRNQNYLYYFSAYLIAGNIFIFSILVSNYFLSDTETFVKFYKVESKKKMKKLINGEFLYCANVRITKQVNKTLLLRTTQDKELESLIKIRTIQSDGFLGYKVIHDIQPIIE